MSTRSAWGATAMVRALTLWALLCVAGCSNVRTPAAVVHPVAWTAAVERMHAIALADDLARLGAETRFSTDAHEVLATTGRVIGVVIIVAAIVSLCVLTRWSGGPSLPISGHGSGGASGAGNDPGEYRCAAGNGQLTMWLILRSRDGKTLAAEPIENAPIQGTWHLAAGDYRLVLRCDHHGIGGELDLGALAVDDARVVTVQCGSAGRQVMVSRP